jgi:hypothetical protein
MKNILKLLLLLIASTLFAQNLPKDKFITTPTTQLMSYRILGNDQYIFTFLYNKDKSSLFFSHYSDSFKGTSWKEQDEVFRTIEVYHKIKNKSFKTQGILFNKSNFVLQGHGELNENNKIAFEKSSDQYEINELICDELIVQVDENCGIKFYVTNLNDGFDYNDLTLDLKPYFGGIDFPKLKPGEIIVEAGMFCKDAPDKYREIILLKENKEENNIFNINKTEFIRFSEQKEHIFDYETKTPVYCHYYDPQNKYNKNIDKQTADRLDSLFRDMCMYFDHFGKYDTKHFYHFYIEYSKEKINLFRKLNLLNSKQLAEFEKEVNKNVEKNKQENLKIEPDYY